MKALNHTEISKNGASLCESDDFVFVQCTNCEQQYLYNQETLMLYLNPNDLTVSELNIETVSESSCTGCKSNRWDFEDIPDSDFNKVQSGPWVWAI